jgi:hypothetical protein
MLQDDPGRAPTLNVDVVALVSKGNRLGSDHLKVVVHSALIAVGEQLQRLGSRRRRLMLLVRFLLQDTQLDQIIFHFLKCIQRCLAICGDGSVVVRLGGYPNSVAAGGVKQSLRELRPDGPTCDSARRTSSPRSCLQSHPWPRW